LHQVLDFINFIISCLKKGAKYLFEELSKLIDEIFGVGKKVEELPKTASEQRVLAKREAQAKRLEDKKNRKVKKEGIKQNKKRFESFKEKWSGKSILELSKTEIANALKGYTEQANKVAKLIEEDKMLFEILEDYEFEKMLIKEGDTLEEAKRTAAFCVGKRTFYRSSTPAEKLLSEFVHEGTHALDNLEGFIGDTYQWEKRAFFHERAFQESVGLEKDFDTIQEMIKFIYDIY
jgi:hypothetical protein